jgi:hypothetical protein
MESPRTGLEVEDDVIFMQQAPAFEASLELGQ